MKSYLISTIIVLIIQVIVSFFVTVNLVNLSQNYQNNSQRLNQLVSTNQRLKSQYYQLTSKTYLQDQVKKLNYFPIEKSIDTHQ